MVTPFVIVNRTDLALVVKRLPRQSEQLEQSMYSRMLEEQNEELTAAELGQSMVADTGPTFLEEESLDVSAQLQGLSTEQQ